MRSELPQIRAFEEEDDDVNWWNDGLDALQANQLNRAEPIFKKLALAQTEDFDGCYGLAQVYRRMQRVDPAILFADEAIRLGKILVPRGNLSFEVADEVLAVVNNAAVPALRALFAPQ